MRTRIPYPHFTTIRDAIVDIGVNTCSSIDQLSKETSESLARIGILRGNAIYIARYMAANPPDDTGRFDDQVRVLA